MNNKKQALILSFSLFIIAGLLLWWFLIITSNNHHYIKETYANYLQYAPEFLWNYRYDIDVRQNFDNAMFQYSFNTKEETISYIGNWWYTLITWVNYNSFTPLTMWYSRDDEQFYYLWEKLDYNPSLHPRRVGEFIADDFNVYNRNTQQQITWVDSKQFHNIPWRNGWSSYYSDDKHIYTYDWKILNDIDITTFKVFNLYAKDMYNVFWWYLPISWADSNSFEVFGDFSLYARDNNNTYFKGEIITGSDLNPLENLIDN